MQDIYKKFEERFEQGDIIPINAEKAERMEYSNIGDNFLGIIILSNSCDLFNKSTKHISFAPIVKLDFVTSRIVEKKREEGKNDKDIEKSVTKNIENIMTYGDKKLFFLPAKKEQGFDFSAVVEIDKIKTLPLEEFSIEFKKSRLISLRNPWKEKLGWMTGNLYNRIALEDHHANSIAEIKKDFSNLLQRLPKPLKTI